MKSLRTACSILVLLILLVPLSQFLESDSEASTLNAGYSAATLGYSPALLLNGQSPAPDFSKLRLLDHLVFVNYVVQPQDHIWAIAKRFGIDVDTIRSSNALEILSISVGKALRIPNHRGTLYQVKSKESLEIVRKNFDWGRRHPDEFRRTVLNMNDYPAADFGSNDRFLEEGSYVFLPNTLINYRQLDIPLIGHFRTTSGFGLRMHPILGVRKEHHGLDLAQPYGQRVNAAREGRVIFAGWSEGYGNLIEIRHVIKARNGYNTISTRYGHLSKILVEPGQTVKKGQMIGRVGSTGISTGPHLHFEIRDASGHARNPWKYLE